VIKKQVQVLQDEVRTTRATAEESNSKWEQRVQQIHQDSASRHEDVEALKDQLETEQNARMEAENRVSTIREELISEKSEAIERQTSFDQEFQELQNRLQKAEAPEPVVDLGSGTPENSGFGRGRLQSRASKQGRASPGSDIEMGGGQEMPESELTLEFKPFAGVPWIPKESQSHRYASLFDQSSVAAGKELSRRPVLRASIAVYLIIVHFVLLMWYLTRSSPGALHA